MKLSRFAIAFVEEYELHAAAISPAVTTDRGEASV
jgi:hypothetical protein